MKGIILPVCIFDQIYSDTGWLSVVLRFPNICDMDFAARHCDKYSHVKKMEIIGRSSSCVGRCICNDQKICFHQNFVLGHFTAANNCAAQIFIRVRLWLEFANNAYRK